VNKKKSVEHGLLNIQMVSFAGCQPALLPTMTVAATPVVNRGYGSWLSVPGCWLLVVGP